MDGRTKGGRPGWAQRLRDWARRRPDSEHEQAVIRLLVGVILFFYLLPRAYYHTGEARETDLIYLGAMVAFLACATVLLLGIALQPGVSRLRRLVGAALDAGTASFFMVAADVHALPLILVYIWITLANGFRYGAAYLLISLLLSLGGFGVVLWLSPFWQQHMGIGVGLMVGMGVLAVYVLTLVRRMSAAVARAEAANEAKRRFVSVMSHEMRTPLNAIVNMADLLRDTELNREQLDMVQTLSGSSRVLLGLVEDVLDFSKIEAGKLVLERIEFDLPALVNSTAKILDQQARDKGLDLVVAVMPQVPAALLGDPHHLRQVLINLMGNAIKFTEKGSVTMHVAVNTETDARVRLKFSVRDTGIGIPFEAQSRIFDSFAQVDESTTRRFGGTGLGTTIAKQLVELMGGRIGLESSVGLGSTFWFEIELEKQVAEAGADAPASGELGGAAILVVGFPDAARTAVVDLLSGWHARSLVADNVGDAAARVVREISTAAPPESALIYARSSPEAQAVMAQLRRAVHAPSLPVVVVMPEGTRPAGMEAVPGEHNAVLEAPIDPAALRRALRGLLGEEAEKSDVVFLHEYLRKKDNGRSLRILVADDTASNRTVISKILERAGHAPMLVETGEQVLDAVDRERFDLIIMDRNMPEVSGLDALKRIRFMYPGRERVPVIVLSADVTPETRDESLQAGADAFLPKPIEAARLLDLIAELRERYGSMPEAPAPAAPAISAVSAPRRASLTAVETPVLNLETIGLLEELGRDGDFMEKLIQAFINDTQTLFKRVERLDSAVAPSELRAMVHALKGSVSSVGADRLTAYCSRVAGMSDAALKAEAPAVLRALKEEFDSAGRALADYLAKRKRTTR